MKIEHARRKHQQFNISGWHLLCHMEVYAPLSKVINTMNPMMKVASGVLIGIGVGD